MVEYLEKKFHPCSASTVKVMKHFANRFEITNTLIHPITGMLVIISVIILRKPGW